MFISFDNRNEAILEYLVEHGADVNKEDEDSETPLSNAYRSGNEFVVKFLVEHGAYVNKENIRGETPLHIL